MKTVSLANQTRAILTFNLPHDLVPELASRGVVGVREHNPTTGERTVQARRKWISGSVTLMPKGTSGDIVRGLPISVLEAPDVKRALGAWPPKVAAKVLDPKEREAEAKAHAEAAAKVKKEAEEHVAFMKAKAAKKAAPAAPAPAVPNDKPSRVARGVKE